MASRGMTSIAREPARDPGRSQPANQPGAARSSRRRPARLLHRRRRGCAFWRSAMMRHRARRKRTSTHWRAFASESLPTCFRADATSTCTCCCRVGGPAPMPAGCAWCMRLGNKHGPRIVAYADVARLSRLGEIRFALVVQPHHEWTGGRRLGRFGRGRFRHRWILCPRLNRIANCNTVKSILSWATAGHPPMARAPDPM
jgi:hypothetical protein